MPVTDAQKRATAKYRKEHTKQMAITFYPSDMELYEYLQSQPEKAKYLKELIRRDMEGRG